MGPASKPPTGKPPFAKNQKKAPVSAKPPATTKTKTVTPTTRLLAETPTGLDIVINEDVEYGHHVRLLSVVHSQTIAVAVLAVLLIVLAPFMQPIYTYYARDADGNLATMDPLLVPNMTNRAVLSWAVTGVTEIMTIGFGDLLSQLGAQKRRFTPEGWESFVNAFRKQQIKEIFKGNQVVLTTVPSDTAVILAQGLNKEGSYQWRVQVPVIMTYTTNDNITRGVRSIVTLTIVRVSPNENPNGIAIKNLIVD